MADQNKVWVLTVAFVAHDKPVDELVTAAEQITEWFRGLPGVTAIRQSCLSTTEAFVLTGDPAGPLHIEPPPPV